MSHQDHPFINPEKSYQRAFGSSHDSRHTIKYSPNNPDHNYNHPHSKRLESGLQFEQEILESQQNRSFETVNSRYTSYTSEQYPQNSTYPEDLEQNYISSNYPSVNIANRVWEDQNSPDNIQKNSERYTQNPDLDSPENSDSGAGDLFEGSIRPDFPENQNSVANKGPKGNRFAWGKLISISVIITSVLFLVAGGFLGYQIMAAGNQDDMKNKLSFFNLGSTFAGFLASGRTPLKGESTGRTNVLVVGVNESPLENGLTDTIMIISYFHKEKKVATLNIPRDLYVSIPGQLEGKVNEVYPVFKRLRPNNKNYGIESLSNFLSKELDISLDYWATVNFDGVKTAIDTVGGIEVDVERTFTDCQYPTDDYSGYLPCQTFKQGLNQMDGTRALIYARSRKSLDPLEGTDFARSQRQARVLQAALKKAKQKKLVENLTQVNNYLNIIGNNTQTNAKPDEMLSGALLLKDFDTENGVVRGNWSDEVGFLCSSSISGSYVLLFGDGINNCSDILGRSKNSAYIKAGKEYLKNILKYAGDNEQARSELIKNTPVTSQAANTVPMYKSTSSISQNNTNNTVDQVDDPQDSITEIPYTPDPQPSSSSSQVAQSSTPSSSKSSSQKSSSSSRSTQASSSSSTEN